MNINNAIELLDEEMGQAGMTVIKKNILSVLKETGQKGKWSFKQKGIIFILYKKGKEFARIPFAKAINKEYLKSIVKGEV